jgi:hypothetical protein
VLLIPTGLLSADNMEVVVNPSLYNVEKIVLINKNF